MKFGRKNSNYKSNFTYYGFDNLNVYYLGKDTTETTTIYTLTSDSPCLNQSKASSTDILLGVFLPLILIVVVLILVIHWRNLPKESNGQNKKTLKNQEDILPTIIFKKKKKDSAKNEADSKSTDSLALE